MKDNSFYVIVCIPVFICFVMLSIFSYVLGSVQGNLGVGLITGFISISAVVLMNYCYNNPRLLFPLRKNHCTIFVSEICVRIHPMDWLLGFIDLHNTHKCIGARTLSRWCTNKHESWWLIFSGTVIKKSNDQNHTRVRVIMLEMNRKRKVDIMCCSYPFMKVILKADKPIFIKPSTVVPTIGEVGRPCVYTVDW